MTPWVEAPVFQRRRIPPDRAGYASHFALESALTSEVSAGSFFRGSHAIGPGAPEWMVLAYQILLGYTIYTPINPTQQANESRPNPRIPV